MDKPGIGEYMNINKNKNRGISLIEVLVTVLILSFGMLGLAGLQAVSMRGNNTAYERTQATYIANEMIDRMRANRSGALNGDYELALADDAVDVDVGGIAEDDLKDWLSQLALLPEGDGTIDCVTASPVCVVTARWLNDRVAGEYQTFVTSGRL